MKTEQNNSDLRKYAKEKNVVLWKIAESYGVHVMTLISRLRKPFTESQSSEFVRIVDEIGNGNGR